MKTTFVFLTLLGLFIVATPVKACIKSAEEKAAITAYYKELRDICKDNSCCLASVNIMEKHGYRRTENGQCPSDINPERLLCTSSFVWCVIPQPQGVTDHCL